MSVVGELVNFLYMLLGATVLILAVGLGMAWYLLKVKKVTAKEEKIDYSNFRREDVTEFVKFDNIISSSGGPGGDSFGIIVLDDKKFISILDIKGYNFRSASAEERERTILNSVAMFNTIEHPIQMRQMTKAIDVSYNISRQEEVCKELEDRIFVLMAEHEDTEALLLECEDNREVYESVRTRLEQLDRELNSRKWEKEEAEEVLRHLRRITTSGNAEKMNQLVFSFEFNPNDYTQELSTEEVYIKASSELALRASNYMHALAQCGCSCKLLTGMEILDLIRRHNHPCTADEVKTRDLFNDNYNTLFISSDELLRLEREKIGEARFKKMMEEEQERRARKHSEFKEMLIKQVGNIAQSVEKTVAEEMAMERG